MAAAKPKTLLAIYLAVFLTLLLLDMVWLLGIARDWYQQGMGHLMAPQPRLGPAALFYLGYPVGVVLFAVAPGPARKPARAAIWGGLFGLFCYGTYDLTNLAVLQGWPAGLAALDMAWGGAVTAFAAAAGAVVARRLNG
ncbi:MAG: DUF2177 family protein [Ramlibacter sp.]|jgi:uncharacterized membrane protein